MLTIKNLPAVGVAALMLLATMTTAAAARVSGAIFTTLVDGSSVDHNIYHSKQDVYLNGGPNSPNACTSAGLPDGDYYFQVTDPSGKQVLSSDDWTQRKVKVSGGVIVQYLGTTPRNTGIGKCGGITVQLLPFDNTPNAGGEYKAWMAPAENFTGFLPSKSKTDNFKAPSDTIDSDGDGLPDDFEVNVSGTDPLNPDTDGDGLTDGQEVNDYYTDPNLFDTDKGGLSDGEEVLLRQDPLNKEDDLMDPM